MKTSIGTDSIIYHIYPYGLCDALYFNDFKSAASHKIEKIAGMFQGLKRLGINTIYIGPVFESTFHGYDISDYFKIDRRLGTRKQMKDFCKKAHEAGFKIVFDAVFNHTGRDFSAFKDLQKNGRKSRFGGWYKNLDFEKESSLGDKFDYESWQGCKDLVKLNLENRDVRKHLFDAAKQWINDYKIDGLRIDAAHLMPMEFLEDLSSFCKSLKPDFWLAGETVHGNYNDFARKNCLDSATNYQLTEHLWKCFNEKNFFRLSNELERQFGKNGIYRNLTLYNFADNHDVNRVATNLCDNSFLIPLYLILFTIPGIPSIYYGSEFCLKGKRTETNDLELRPALPPFADSVPEYANPSFNPNLMLDFISRISKIRSESEILKNGGFRTVFVKDTFLCYERFERYGHCGNHKNYERTSEGKSVFVLINIGDKDEFLDLSEICGNRHKNAFEFTELFSMRKIVADEKFTCPSRQAFLIQKNS